MSAYATDALGPALLALMAEKDIRKVTADELAERAGVGRATYFRNFRSKEELLAAYLVRRWRVYEKAGRLKQLQLSHPFRAQRYFEFFFVLDVIAAIIMFFMGRNYEKRFTTPSSSTRMAS